MRIAMDGKSMVLDDEQQEFYEDALWRIQGETERAVRAAGLIENDECALHVAERTATFLTFVEAGIFLMTPEERVRV